MVVFVLGGPGVGKGTQCNLLAAKYGLVHLSAGDLLREERERPESEYGDLINSYIVHGKIVPMHITIGLLKNAMLASGKQAFLIDGFPRDVAQGDEFERVVCESKGMLFLSCAEETMTERLLTRGNTSGRVDDNAQSILKRLHTYRKQTLPVKAWAEAVGKLFEVDAGGPIELVFQETSSVLQTILTNQ